MILLLVYVLVIPMFLLWDAFIGFGFEFPDFEHGPNAVCCALFWPLSLPIVMIIYFGSSLDKIKAKRLLKQKEKVRMENIFNQEIENSSKQLDKEI